MLTATLPLGAGERITMKVSPAVSFAPANLIVRATVLADADNRAVQIIAESADFYRSSEVQLEGEQAARTNRVEFRSLPPGTYEVRANLLRNNGCGHEPKAEGGGLRLETLLHTVTMSLFVLPENGLVVRLAGLDQVIHDAGQLVSGGGDGLRSPELRPHPAIVAAERRTTALHRLR